MIIGTLLCLFALLGVATPALAQSADTILVGGRVVTLDARSTIAERMAIRGGKITAVGGAADIKRISGAKTVVIDLAGRIVIPGLIDSHMHAIRAGLWFGRGGELDRQPVDIRRHGASSRRCKPCFAG